MKAEIVGYLSPMLYQLQRESAALDIPLDEFRAEKPEEDDYRFFPALDSEGLRDFILSRPPLCLHNIAVLYDYSTAFYGVARDTKVERLRQELEIAEMHGGPQAVEAARRGYERALKKALTRLAREYKKVAVAA